VAKLTLPAPHGLLRLFSSSLSLRDFHKDPALPLASIIPIMTAFFSPPRYDLSAKAYYVPNTIGNVPISLLMKRRLTGYNALPAARRAYSRFVRSGREQALNPGKG
jgi:hypothetical protein